MEALIVYSNKNGTTRRYAETIANLIKRKFNSLKIKSIEEASSEDIAGCDVLYLGCSTDGMMVFGQKPEQPWIDFVSKVPHMEGKKTVLFTTYKFSTGKVFQRMKLYLQPKGYKVIGSMKSQDGNLNYNTLAVLKYSVA